MNRAKVLKKMIENTGLNLKAFAEKAGIPYTTLYSILERGVGKASVDNIIKICKTLGISVEEMERMSSSYNVSLAESETSYGDSNDKNNLVLLPIVGTISCGNGSFAYEIIEGYEPVPKEWLNDGEYFFLRAKGDSMIGARIHEGDLLLIRKQPIVDDGEIAAVLLDGEEAVLKRVYRNNGQLVLQSENPKYPPIFAPPAEAKIIGKLKMNFIKF